ncbi:Phosphoglycerate mutase-like protein AT74H [Glycine soja]
MTQTLHANKHLRRVMDSDDCFSDWRVQFYVPPYIHTRLMFHELRKCFLKKRIIGMREESRV